MKILQYCRSGLLFQLFPCGGVAVAISSLQFHVLYFPVSYWLTVSYLTKHENQIVFHIVKEEVNFRGKKKHNLLCK